MRPAVWLLIVATLLATSCGVRLLGSVEEVPIPPSARKDVIEGAYEVPLDNAIATVRRELRETYGRADVAIYHLPEDAEWPAILGFYEDRLAPTGLKRDARFPVDHARHKLAVWGHDGWFSKQAVAVAIVEPGTTADGRPLKLLAVFLTQS